jgi:putative drug exporter of the RND superfamily
VATRLFERLGAFVVRRRWAIVVAWSVLLVAAIPLAPRAPGVLVAGGFQLDDLESARARAVLERELGIKPSALALVAHSDSARAGEPTFESELAEVVARVRRAPSIVAVTSHLDNPRQVSADGRTVYEVVWIDLPPDRSPDAVPGVRAALAPAPVDLQLSLAGGPVFYGDILEVSESDLRRSEAVSLPLAALVLLLVFGSVVAAGVPLIVGGSAVVVGLAVITILAALTPLSIFVLNLATLMGLGLGVDYALLVTTRFREELSRRGGGRTASGAIDRGAVDEAVVATVSTAGRAVFFSGLTVLLGLTGLVLFEFMLLRSVGIAGAVVVGLAAAAALTLMPAVLAILGPRLEAFPLPGRHDAGTPSHAWERLARRVMAHPVQVLVPTLALLLVLGAPFLSVRFNAPDATILPPYVPSRQSLDLLQATFGEGDFAPLWLAVRTPGPATDPANVAALFDYTRRLESDPRVTHIDSIVDLDPRLSLTQYQVLYADPTRVPDRYAAVALAASTREDLTFVQVFTPYGPNAQEGRALVREMRDPGSPLAPPGGFQVLVAGGAAEVEDVVARIAADFPRTAIFILVTTYLVLLLLLRSVVLPAKALVMNSLSIVASFGALVWIFQQGNLSALLGFTPLGYVETSQPVILFCVLFGLSMDYEVFLLSRMKEVYDRTGDNVTAVARGLERSGRIVTSAALVVVVVASSFAFADIVLIKALGLGVAIAVGLDATVVRALLVPATMRLLGKWNWWLPAALDRILPRRVHLAEEGA